MIFNLELSRRNAINARQYQPAPIFDTPHAKKVKAQMEQLRAETSREMQGAK